MSYFLPYIDASGLHMPNRHHAGEYAGLPLCEEGQQNVPYRLWAEQRDLRVFLRRAALHETEQKMDPLGDSAGTVRQHRHGIGIICGFGFNVCFRSGARLAGISPSYASPRSKGRSRPGNAAEASAGRGIPAALGCGWRLWLRDPRRGAQLPAEASAGCGRDLRTYYVG